MDGVLFLCAQIAYVLPVNSAEETTEPIIHLDLKCTSSRIQSLEHRWQESESVGPWCASLTSRSIRLPHKCHLPMTLFGVPAFSDDARPSLFPPRL